MMLYATRWVSDVLKIKYWVNKTDNGACDEYKCKMFIYLTTTDRLEVGNECWITGVNLHVASMTLNKTNVPRPHLHRKYTVATF